MWPLLPPGRQTPRPQPKSGRFLAGFALPDSPKYEQWLAEQGHYYENRYLAALAQWLQEWAGGAGVDTPKLFVKNFLK
jgi:DNA-binding SARP family transcriptional activator